jgi:protein-L-isoaspartate(D-aspartate) O-methyltransferase
VVGRALDALNLKGDEKVLEIGTGTGYITACLSHLARQVVSIEIEPSLLQLAEQHLSAYRNVKLIEGNGALGWQALAPYDAIIVTGSYPIAVPLELMAQLQPGTGRLFAVQGLKPAMQAILMSGDKTESLFETVIPALQHAPQPAPFKF